MKTIEAVSILISIFALIISLIGYIRLFLLDKEYCELYLEKGEATGLGAHTCEQKEGYVTTILHPIIHILKNDIYELNFKEKKQEFLYKKFYPEEKTFYIKKEKGSFLKFYYTGNIPREILISFVDSKNNYYTQKLKIIPFFNKKTPEDSTHWDIILSPRKWHFLKSIKRKYL